MRVKFISLLDHAFFKVICWIATRFITLIIIFILLFRWLTNPLQMISKSLNQLMPESFKCLNNYNSQEGKCTEEELQGFVKYFTQVVKRFPHQPEGYGLLAFCYYHLNEIEKSKKNYLKAVSLNQHFFWFHFNLGVIHLKEGDYQRAEEFFNQAMAADGERTMEDIRISIIYGPLRESIQEFEYFIQKKLFVGYSYASALSKICYFLKNFDANINDFNMIDRNSAHLDHVYYRLGLEAYHNEQLDIAEIFMQKTLEANPQYVDAIEYLGRIFQSQGKKKLAQEYFDQAVQLRSSNQHLRSFDTEVTLQIF